MTMIPVTRVARQIEGRQDQSTMAPKGGKPGSSGFSLMEVLVAISLLGISYTIIFSLMTTSLKNVNRIEERERIARHGQMKLNELVLKEQRGEEGYALSGTFDESYGWKAEVLPYLVEQGEQEAVKVRPLSLVRIRLTVDHQSHDPRSVYSIETFGWRTKLQ